MQAFLFAALFGTVMSSDAVLAVHALHPFIMTFWFAATLAVLPSARATFNAAPATALTPVRPVLDAIAGGALLGQAAFTALSLGGMAGCNPAPPGAMQGWFSLAMCVQAAMTWALGKGWWATACALGLTNLLLPMEQLYLQADVCYFAEAPCKVLEAGPDGKLVLRSSGAGRWLIGPAISLSKSWLVAATNVMIPLAVGEALKSSSRHLHPLAPVAWTAFALWTYQLSARVMCKGPQNDVPFTVAITVVLAGIFLQAMGLLGGVGAACGGLGGVGAACGWGRRGPTGSSAAWRWQ